MQKTFVTFEDIKKYPKVLGVDCYHPHAFCLSHWRGTPTPLDLQDDTSAGIVINAIKFNIPELAYPFVSSNHFDIDGFVGVWSLLNPALALKYEAVLRQMALIGDFREYQLQLPASDLALKLVCYINTVEKQKFYPPFGAQFTEEKEAILCVEKFNYFLGEFEQVLSNIDTYQEFWQEEYAQVMDGLQAIQNHGNILNFDNIKLQVVICPEPVHYYALFAQSRNADMVLSIYDNNRYELEYKYTTWINAYTRLSFPRTNLMSLAKKLNEIEKSGFKWDCQNITDTGTVLRLNGKKLTKEQRYDHPFNRSIESSSIPAQELINLIDNHFEKALANLPKKNAFTWKEVKGFALVK